jgi:MHS family shikimate/dehydroshikimate transporter-like MFS transporter
MSDLASALPLPNTTVLVQPGASHRWVIASTMIGSIIEWYDFYIYGTAAALVFGKLYFPSSDPKVATLAALLSFAVGLFARPVGAILFGHFGDRIGRKSMLLFTLFLMGIPSALIGLVPTYASIGIWAPVILVLLRITQGLAIGGEWGGAVLMAVEHAPGGRRGIFGAMPQIGVPAGVLLSVGAFSLVSLMPEADFLAWGWRLPFLASVLLVFFGLFVRWRIQESPEFERVRDSGRTHRVPIVGVMRERWRSVLLAAGGKVGEVTFFFLTTVYLISYITGRLSLPRSLVLNVVLIGAGLCTIFIPVAGLIADRFGARRVYGIGAALLAIAAVPMFLLIETREPLLIGIAIAVPFGFIFPLMYAPQPSLYAAQFPPELRYSGMSIGVSLASAIAGGLAPIIATGLVEAYRSSIAVGVYLAVAASISAVSVFLMKKPDHDV